MKADDPRHGSYAGYQAHRRVNETPCADCCAASTRRRRERRSVSGRAPTTACKKCYRRTESRSGMCRRCSGVTSYDDCALTGGQWVSRDGIMRWEAA